MLAVRYASAENQPAFAVFAALDNFSGYPLVVVVLINGGLQFAFDVFTATLMNASGIHLDAGDFALQRTQITLVYQFLDRDRFQHVIEKRDRKSVVQGE